MEKTIIVRVTEEKKAAFHSAVIAKGLTIFAVLEGAIDLFLSDKPSILIKHAVAAQDRRHSDDKRSNGRPQ